MLKRFKEIHRENEREFNRLKVSISNHNSKINIYYNKEINGIQLEKTRAFQRSCKSNKSIKFRTGYKNKKNDLIKWRP